MAVMRIYGFILVTLSCAFYVYAKDICVKKSSCVCVFPNGTGIDLTPAVSSNFYQADIYDVKKNGSEYEMFTYYYHPCYDVKINVTTPETVNTCTDPLSICRFVTNLKETNVSKTFDIEKSYDFMGRSNISDFSDNGDYITYHNGPSDTIVLLRCAQTENQLQVYSISEPNKIVLAFYSRDACPKLIEESGRSFGSTLLIIFFSFVVFYLVLGICTKKFLMGATGIEVIPNLGFWSELPNLVKDGWLFMSNGFKLPVRATGQTVSPDPNSYDSI